MTWQDEDADARAAIEHALDTAWGRAAWMETPWDADPAYDWFAQPKRPWLTGWPQGGSDLVWPESEA